MTEQELLQGLNQMCGGKLTRFPEEDKRPRGRKSAISDAELRHRLKRLHDSGMPWDEIQKALPAGNIRVGEAYRALVAAGAIQPRPHSYQRKRLLKGAAQ